MSDRAEEIAAALDRTANDAMNWSDSYAGQRQGRWLTNFATAARDGSSTIRTLTAQLKEATEKYENLKDTHIEATEAIRAEYLGRYLAAESSLSSLRERVRPLVKELADDLDSLVEAHYAGIKDHPAMTPKYERDMEPVKQARAFLSTLPHDGEG